MKTKLFLLLSLMMVFVNICFSQTYIGQEASSYINNVDVIKFKNHSKVPNYFRFSANATYSEEQAIAVVKSFITNANSDLQLKEVQINGDSSQTVRYYQTVSGIPIEFSALNLQVKNNRVSEVNGEILDNPEITPNFVLSEAEALLLALQFVNAELYMWQEDSTYFPQGEMVIVPDKIYFRNSKLKSAYKFDIYSLKPYDRKMVYVDAETGEIVLEIPLIHFSNVLGKAQTAYYGERSINMDYNSNTQKYTLRDSTRGKGVFTYNCNRGTSYSSATNFSNDSSNWVIEPYATTAHFSTMMTYDYYKNIHGRNSIDGNGFALISYVHYDVNYANAFWNGQYMTYGDGNPNANPKTTPLTTMDICGHEITHGLTSKTADLVYAFESGALNESFSDIFGTAIEFYAVPEDANWTVGEKFGRVIRSMSNPNLYNNPKTYQGKYWVFGSSDNGGVHYNSGVLNYWFYLLCEGGSGVNDLGKQYAVTGIGMSKAEKIAFKLLTELLTASSEYEDACFFGLQAATTIYGACSDELKAVGDAFYAVGLLERPYEKYASANFSSNINVHCAAPITVSFLNQSFNANSYLWDFGDGTPTSTQMNPSHYYAADGDYTVTLIADGGTCGRDTFIQQNFIRIAPDLPCTYLMTSGTRTVENCRGIIYDNGGPNGNHTGNLSSQLTVRAIGADSIVLHFAEFDLEACTKIPCECDYLSVYRGTTTTSGNLIGRYCNLNQPPKTITVPGNSVTFYFYSDPYVNLKGFKIEYNCVMSGNPPLAFFDVDNTKPCEGIIHFEDRSVGTQINSWMWNFGDGTTSTLQHPSHQYYTNGKYNVSLTVGNANGEDSLTKTNYILVENMVELGNLQFEGDTAQAFNLYIPDASGDLKWYENKADVLSSGTPKFTGNPILHPAVSGNKTYYVLDKEVEKYQVGETVCTGSGRFFDADVSHYLIFDAYQDFSLKSVLVNAQTCGYRVVALRTENQDVLWTKNVYMPAGTSRVIIDEEVPEATNLQLVCSAYPFLFRSDVNAALKYPYTIEDVVSIKSSSAGAPDALRYYYFFYDWEIKTPNCNSELSTVKIIVTDDSTAVKESILSKVIILPNPSKGIYRIDNLQNIENHTITVSEVTGKTLTHPNLIRGNVLDLSEYASGVYFVRIDERVFKVVKY